MATTLSSEVADAAIDQPEAVESDTDVTAEPDATAPNHRRSIAVLIGLLVVVAATACATILGSDHRDHVAANDRDQSIATAARQVVTNLVTLRYNSADADVKRIRENATGDFLKQMGDTTGGFATVLQQGKVESTGTASEVAILDANDSTATVIAAVTSTVKNSDAPQGQPRVYRMKLFLTHQGDRWLVSNVEFVS